MLTTKQHELLLYIYECLDRHGVPPSYDEMKDAVRLKSKSGIHRLIQGLEERGYIRRLANRARAIEILRLPENFRQPGTSATRQAAGSVPPGGRQASGFKPRLVTADGLSDIKGHSREMTLSPERVPSNSLPLPLYGRIAAGLPIEALRDSSTTIDVPGSMLSNGEYYALEVAGDSMIDAGILDGDVVVIERCDTAENGHIIVALIDESEVTLKRLRRKGQSIALEPANKHHETRIFGPDRVRIQGRLVGLIRRYR